MQDPVCGMQVTLESKGGTAQWQGKTYAFCSEKWSATHCGWLVQIVERPAFYRGKERTMAKDPVCGMKIEEEKAQHILYTDQDTFYFCSEACRESYSAHSVNSTKHGKGRFRRFLEKIAQGNEQSYGGQPPKCH